MDERVAAARPSLSPAEERVAGFLVDHREEAVFLSAAEIAERIDSSDATVIRAVQSLGYSGLPALKSELQDALRPRATPTLRLGRSLDELGGDPAAVIDHALATEMQLLQDARSTLRPADLSRALDLLTKADRVLVQGLGPNEALASYFSLRLRRMKRHAEAFGARGAALADQLIDMRRGDVLIVLAYERTTPEAEVALERAKEIGIPTVLVTDTLGLALAGRHTVALSARRAGGGMFHLSAITIVILDMLLFGIAGRDRAGALQAADEMQELRDRITAQIGEGTA